MESEFNVEKWKVENPMDYIKAMTIINQASNKNEVFEILYRITRLHLPDTLFKFHSLTDDCALNELKLETLRSHKIYMSDVKDLNDPFDNKAFFYRPDALMKYEILAESKGKLIEDFTSYVKTASFTVNNVNSMPMWAHYSNNHTGYCISYDMKDKRNVQFSSCTFPLQYINKRIDITDLMDNQVNLMIDEIEKQGKRGKKAIQITDLSMVFMASFFSNIKHKTWGYEREYRCTAGAIADGMPFLPASPKEIFIGMNCKKEYTDELVKLADEMKISAYKMIFNDYDMDFSLDCKRMN